MFGWFKKNKNFDIRNTRIIVENYEFVLVQKYLFEIGCDWLHYKINKTSIKNNVMPIPPFNSSRLIIDVDEDLSFDVKPFPADKNKYKVLGFDELKILNT